MKTILSIIKYDARKLTSSVVAIITIVGLCIIPCLYAWFNIFSNWAPYDADATGRILVAVANNDEGSKMMGIKVNVGDKIVEALKANDSIGWRFVDSSDEAVEGVRAGDYYAALVVPEDFSTDVMSFVTGTLVNPKLFYYENEKKNAIAPKITGKAKTAVQEQVNATFIETLARYASDAASVMEESGYNPQAVFSDLSDKMELLSDRLDDCEVMLNGAAGLAQSAESLIQVSGQLLGSAQVAVEGQEGIVDAVASDAADASKNRDSVSSALTKEKAAIDQNLSEVNKDLAAATEDLEKTEEYIDKRLPDQLAEIENMRQSAERTEKYLNDLGFTLLADQFGQTKERLAAIEKDMEELIAAEDSMTPEEKQERLRKISEDIESTRKHVSSIDEKSIDSLDAQLDKAIKDARTSLADVQKSLAGMDSGLSGLGDVLDGYSNALTKLQSSLGSTDVSLGYMKNGINTMSEVFSRIAGNRTADEVLDLLASDQSSVAEYLASPVKMRTEVVYPIENYGSAMAPFYTVLAQWVGALLTAVLIKTRIKNRSDLGEPKLYVQFFGRYGLYMFIGIAQALIVSLGDLLYVGIQCHHPVLFVLQACMNGITFMMINYALVFALENIGLGAGVIILVMQVAGSGGTYPVEVLPDIFKVLYPFMPFRYSMDAMRECIAGTYGDTYARCMGTLCIFLVASMLLGLLLYRPAKWLNRLIAESKEKSEIML